MNELNAIYLFNYIGTQSNWNATLWVDELWTESQSIPEVLKLMLLLPALSLSMPLCIKIIDCCLSCLQIEDVTEEIAEAQTSNEEKLAKIGFFEGHLPRAKRDAYQNYICSISQTIMTKPVYARGYPQYHFEDKHIRNWLIIKQQHPMLDSKLLPHMLVLNEKLQQEISDFVTEQYEWEEDNRFCY